MRSLRAAYDLAVVALACLAGATVVLCFVLIVVDVSVRALGMRPPALTSATVEYILLYYTLLAAPYLVRSKGHVYIDALTSRLPSTPRLVLEKVVYLVCITSALAFAYLSAQLLVEAYQSGLYDERSVDIPYWVLYAPMPVSFTLVATEFLRYLVGGGTMYHARTDVVDSL